MVTVRVHQSAKINLEQFSFIDILRAVSELAVRFPDKCTVLQDELIISPESLHEILGYFSQQPTESLTEEDLRLEGIVYWMLEKINNSTVGVKIENDASGDDQH